MIKEARGYGNTIDEARENAVAMLNASENDDIQFEVIATPKKKTLGIFGGRKAEVLSAITPPTFESASGLPSTMTRSTRSSHTSI